jgi:BirA family biotin operon repressor/biotin-[acetyl-CoA-carboxylase] ligase
MTDRVAAFDAAAIADGLDAPYRIEFHDALESTNDRARELAEDGGSGVAVVAREQTAGRGRRGRTWDAPEGGAYVSVVLEPEFPPAAFPLVTMAAAVATARAVHERGVEAGIKWPNDVLVGSDDGKIAGILTERVGDRVVVGVGVNVDVDPAALPDGAESVAGAGGDPDRAAVVRRILAELAACLDDPDGILPAWRELSHTLGLPVRVETPGGVVEGEAVDVEHPGTLVVETAEGAVRVSAGDCEHLRTV